MNTALSTAPPLSEQTLGDYQSDSSITRERAEDARPYDLVFSLSFNWPRGQEKTNHPVPAQRNRWPRHPRTSASKSRAATTAPTVGLIPITGRTVTLLAALQRGTPLTCAIPGHG